jgi:peptidoglycan/xylan/chitin deacetylase (PgdA/CDA1 family)
MKNVRLLLVGDGPQRRYLENRAAELGIAHKVIFTGIRTDIAELLNIMDVYVNSSVREGVPVSLLEAMAGEKAVVATEVGGIPEVINDKSIGITVPPEDPKAMADGIISLLNNEELRKEMGLKARARILKRFSVRAQAGEIDSLYEELLRAGPRDKEKGIPVIMYHSVGPMNTDWTWNDLITPVEVFEGQIRVLSQKGFNAITLRELYNHMKYYAELLPNPVVLTFDDGYLDNWVYAYPILKKYHMKGTIYVNPEFVDPASEPRMNLVDVWKGRCGKKDLFSEGFLSWEEMRIMEADRVMDIQSHSMTHTWYFCGDEIVDFHHPGSNKYPWLFWNAFPEEKSSYLKDNQELYVPYGTPIYKHGRSLGIRRYFEDRYLTDYLVDYVKRQSNDFFKDSDWKDKLFLQVELYKSKNGLKGRYETEEEQRERFRYELIESRKLIEEILQKRVEFLCWAGGAFNDKALRIAEEAGYLSSTLFYNNKEKKNRHGEDPSFINRTGCVDSFKWRNKFMSYTDPAYFIHNINCFYGSRKSFWIMRLYKLKYLFKYSMGKLFRSLGEV